MPYYKIQVYVDKKNYDDLLYKLKMSGKTMSGWLRETIEKELGKEELYD